MDSAARSKNWRLAQDQEMLRAKDRERKERASQLMSEVQKEDLRRKNRESKKLARQKKKSSDSSSNKKSESSKAKIIQPYLCKDGKPYSFQRSPINFSMDDLEVSDDDDNTSYVGIPMKSPDISRRPSNRRCKIQN